MLIRTLIIAAVSAGAWRHDNNGPVNPPTEPYRRLTEDPSAPARPEPQYCRVIGAFSFVGRWADVG
jgi:hypothetical protein